MDIWGDTPAAPLGLGCREHITDQKAQKQCPYAANRGAFPDHAAIVKSQPRNKKATNRTAFVGKLR